MKTIDLVSDVAVVLSGTIMDWKRLNASDGDLAHFSDLESYPERSWDGVGGSLSAIKKTFDQLEKLRDNLNSLEKSCSNDAEGCKSLRLLQIHVLTGVAENPVDRRRK